MGEDIVADAPVPSAPMTLEAALAELTRPGAEFEMVVTSVSGRPTRVFQFLEGKSLRDYYEGYGRLGAGRTWLVWNDQRWTFAQGLELTAQVAASLLDLGVRKGDRVAIASRNCPEWIWAFQGATSIGAIAVGLNSWGQRDELEQALGNSTPRVLFCDEPRFERLAGSVAAVEHVFVIRPGRPLPAGVRAFDEFISGAAGRPMPDVTVSSDDDALILYTSGSTGHAKGAISSHRNILSALHEWKLETYTRFAQKPWAPGPHTPEQPAVLLTVPLFHVSGLLSQYLESLIWGEKVVMMPRWDAAEALRLIARERITRASGGPPTMDWDLMQHATIGETDVSSVAEVGGGGAARPVENVARIQRTFPNAVPVEAWGMTETSAIGSSAVGEEYVKRPTSCGRPAWILDVRIVDENENELPVGQAGEIQVRGASVIRGYWNDPQATADAITDGWVRSGDVGYLDSEGFLYISGRIKDMVIRGGENIHCAEVEAVLYAHPAVLEATVFGVPDERLGEALAAVIVPRRGYEPGDEEVKRFVGERLAAFKVPEHVWFRLDPLPRLASEKIAKRQVRSEVIALLSATP